MRIIAAATLALLPLAATAAQPVEREPNQRAEAPQAMTPSLDRMNVYQARPGCVPVPQQVAGTERRNGTRLDQQPPGRALLAVDRVVDGCHEVVLISEEQRRQRQGR
jgi:hypothetical protein